MNEKPKRAKKKGKAQKKQKAFDLSAPQIGQLRNALAEMTESYEERSLNGIYNYLMTVVDRRKNVFENIYSLRTLLRAVKSLESTQSLEFLEHYQEVFMNNPALSKEIFAAKEEQENYLKGLKEFSAAAAVLENELLGVDVKTGLFLESLDKIDNVKARFDALCEKFEFIKDGKKGEKLLNDQRTKLVRVIEGKKSGAQAELEKKRSDFLDKAKAWEKKARAKFININRDEKTSPAQKCLELISWENAEVLPRPSPDIVKHAEVAEMLKHNAGLWQEIRGEITAKVDKLSYIAKNKIKFEFSADLKTLHFDNIEIVMGINKDTVCEEMFEVIRVFLEYNPQADIDTAVSGTENEISSGFFLPLLERAKEMIAEEKQALEFSRQAEEFMKEQDAQLNALVKDNSGSVETIKQVRDFLNGEFSDPKFAEGFDSDLKDPRGIMQKALDDFSAWTQKVNAFQEEVETVCLGMFRLEVEGDYKYLYFTPLSGNVDMAKAKNALANIWRQALEHNLDVEMKVPSGMANASWIENMQDIWESQYDIVKQAKEEQALIDEKSGMNKGTVSPAEKAISRAI